VLGGLPLSTLRLPCTPKIQARTDIGRLRKKNIPNEKSSIANPPAPTQSATIAGGLPGGDGAA